MTLSGRTITRRGFLATGATTAALVGAETVLPSWAFGSTAPGARGSAAGAGAAPSVSGAMTSGATRPQLASLINPDPVLHVARRLTYGPTTSLVASIRKVGIRSFVESQLSPASLPDTTCRQYLARYPLVGLGPAAVRDRLPNGSWQQMDQMPAAALVRAVWSTRQLYELMTDFWWNHFNVGIPNSDVWDLAGAHEQVIRAGALGRFADLLKAVAHSPAMLRSLNQDQSVGANPNENYAREMLELHTVGAHGGYGEHDVHEAALLLTGLGIASDGYHVTFTPGNHYVGPVAVMGFADPNATASGGASLILSYLDYLAHHPATARHLANELAVRFVCDQPPPSLVDKLAGVYLRSGTAIVPVLRALFSSSEFMASTGHKVRRPLEAVAASLRVLDYRLKSPGTSDLGDIVFALGIMGQKPFAWPEPNGYPDTAGAWKSASDYQAEWAMHLRLTGGWWTKDMAFPGTSALCGNPPDTLASGSFVDRVCRRLLFQTVTPAHRAMMLQFLGRSEAEPIGTAGLAALPLFAMLVLDSPYFGVR